MPALKSKLPYIQIKNFSQSAVPMRRFFDSVYADPRKSVKERFVWDFWEVPDQYRLHRTTARMFFPEKLFKPLLNDLLRFGQEELGCHSISEPWMSFYNEGCFQKLHTDSPHGPWAFVYSLTNWQMREFTGGETLILKPEILDFSKNEMKLTKKLSRGLEHNNLFHQVPTHFNQLLIFDPSIPHGVEMVRNVFAQSKSRLVLHGWFVQPEAFVTGGLNENDVSDPLNIFFERFTEAIEDFDVISGLCTWSMDIVAGKTKNIELKTDRLRGLSLADKKEFLRICLKLFNSTVFPKSSKKSKLVLPMIF